MTRAVWDDLLAKVRSMHESNVALSAFCPFPDDIRAQPVVFHDIPARRLMQADSGLGSRSHAAVCDAFLAAGQLAQWRETYKDTDIDPDFMDRFACYCLIGDGGAFMSDRMWAWVVYMPSALWYPWHHHPAEEAYLILAGEAEFLKSGHAPATLREGDIVQHDANQPHATETRDSPFMAYVVWRNGFDVKPVLTPEDWLQ